MLFRSDNRMLLDMSERQLDYQPVRGLGKDRDQLPTPLRLVCFIRQRGVCAYCCAPLVITVEGKSFSMMGAGKHRPGELDHAIPVWQGGRDDYRGYCYLCSYHNGYEFKGGNIEFHGAFHAARLGQTIAEDWRSMLRAFIASGLKIYAVPYWWYQPTLPRRLNLPGYNMDTGKLDLSQTFAVEKTFFDRNLKEFLDGEKYGRIKKMILPELARHDAAYR